MQRDPALVTELLSVADALAEAARRATLAHFRRRDLSIDDKGAGRYDPVTEADRDAEIAMRQVLARLRPDDGLVAEEFGDVRGSSGLVWVLDPIDGTRSFVAGAPVWGVLIAVADATGPFLGLIDQPFIGERFVGSPGYARVEGPRGAAGLATRPPRPLAEATLFTTFPEIGSEAERAAFTRVADAARLTRYGLDCYAYAMLAAGHIDLVIEAGLAPYDIAAPLALIEAAGGLVTAWDGGDAAAGGRVLAAANRAIHAEAMALLAS